MIQTAYLSVALPRLKSYLGYDVACIIDHPKLMKRIKLQLMGKFVKYTCPTDHHAVVQIPYNPADEYMLISHMYLGVSNGNS